MNAPKAQRKFHAVYVVLDVSQSMRWVRDGNGRTPQRIFSQMIKDLLFALNTAPQVSTTTWMSVVTFADSPRTIRSMAPLREHPGVHAIQGGESTNYARVLEYLAVRAPIDAQHIKSQEEQESPGYEILVAAPHVFFITDGAPFSNGRYQSAAEWMEMRDRLVNPPIDSRIATFGLPGAEERTLCDLATGHPERNAFVASRRDLAGSIQQTQSLANSISIAIRDSVRQQAATGHVMLTEPSGMRRARR